MRVNTYFQPIRLGKLVKWSAFLCNKEVPISFLLLRKGLVCEHLPMTDFKCKIYLHFPSLLHDSVFPKFSTIVMRYFEGG